MIISKDLNFTYCLVDWHVHFYPTYNYVESLLQVFKKLASYQKSPEFKGEVLGILVLTERADCHFYQDLSSKVINLEPEFKTYVLSQGVLIESLNQYLLILPGRQLNTIEKIEILSLGQDHLIQSRQDLKTTMKQIRDQGALPVINWAPGKWWFRRGRILKNYLIENKEELYLCDTSLRPEWYPTPLLSVIAKKRGVPVLVGSDPLPDSKEQDRIFSYIAYYQSDFNLDEPLQSLKKLAETKPSKTLGKRSTWCDLFFRLKRYYSKNKN